MSHARRRKVAQNSEDSDSDIEPPTKRVALQDSNTSRYHREFRQLELIGTGKFGSVYKCINRLDGCTYAIKKKPFAVFLNDRNVLNQLNVQDVLEKHQHLVQYYSAWAEDNHMIIQNEYCNGGSLAEVIENLQQKNEKMSEPKLRQLLLHIAKGLQYIHSMQLVHLDIKPGNIFISKKKRLLALNYDSADDGFDEEKTAEERITYKIGDFSSVTFINNPQVKKSDSRYEAPELIVNNFTHLAKAAIFSLGMVVYEAGGSGPLPKNDKPDWFKIRTHNLEELPHCSRDLNDLLKLMTHLQPEMRPSAASLVRHPVLRPLLCKTNAQLREELNAMKLNYGMLCRHIHEGATYFNTLAAIVSNFESNIDRCDLRKTHNPLPSTSTSCPIQEKRKKSIPVSEP